MNMNKRILDLAFEANADLDGYMPIGFAEKFAELIIQECCDIVVNDYDSRTPEERVCSIRKHFGIW